MNILCPDQDMSREQRHGFDKLCSTPLAISLTYCVQAPHSRRDWQADYRRLSLLSEEPLRFLGAFTSGGCDDELNQYWVDNLFTDNHWSAYCSHEGFANINCLGLLLVSL